VLVDVSVIFVSYNTAQMSVEAIRLVKESLHQLAIEIFVIDNASKDGSADLIAQTFPDVTLIANTQNVGFGRANNQALPLLSGRYVLLLNTDAFVQRDTIQKTVEFMDAHMNVGILGVRLLGRDGVLQPSCRYFPSPWALFLHRTGLNKFFTQVQMVDDMSWDHHAVRYCDWVPGCYYLIRKQAIDQVGLFDPRYFLYYEEVDHCYATKQAGWDVVYYPDTSVVHIGGESAKIDHKISQVGRQVSALQIESELLYFRKNHGLVLFLMHLLMATLAEFVLFFKRLLKHPSDFTNLFNFKALILMWRLVLQTQLGTKSIH
jgi:GT2 family glycosyltransferase